jgi:iron complex transport system substrate-binding protein
MKTNLCLFLASIVSFSLFAQPVQITHQLGQVTLEAVPKRVVVIGLGALDALDAFGIEPVAITKAIQLPDYLEKYKSDKYASSGSLFEPDFESIYSQKPDVIIVGARSSSHYEELSKIAPTIVFAIDEKMDYWQSTQAQWRNLATLFNIGTKVEHQIGVIEKQFLAIRQYNQEHHTDALTVMSAAGNLTTFGATSRFSVIYQTFGFVPTVKEITSSRHGDLISYEFISQSNPAILFVIDRDKLVNKGESTTREAFHNDLIKTTQAYKNNRITFLDLNAWYLSIAGVTATQKMIDDIKSTIGLD